MKAIRVVRTNSSFYINQLLTNFLWDTSNIYTTGFRVKRLNNRTPSHLITLYLLTINALQDLCTLDLKNALKNIVIFITDLQYIQRIT